MDLNKQTSARIHRRTTKEDPRFGKGPKSTKHEFRPRITVEIQRIYVVLNSY
jgi:hypothetical protein